MTSSLATRRYSIQPGDWKFVKVYRFLSFDKNVSKTIGKNISKNLSSKYIQKLLDHAKLLPASRATKVAKDALRTASKRAIKKLVIKLMMELQVIKSQEGHHRIVDSYKWNKKYWTW